MSATQNKDAQTASFTDVLVSFGHSMADDKAKLRGVGKNLLASLRGDITRLVVALHSDNDNGAFFAMLSDAEGTLVRSDWLADSEVTFERIRGNVNNAAKSLKREVSIVRLRDSDGKTIAAVIRAK